MPKITLNAVGRVRNSVWKTVREGWEGLVSEIVLARAYEDGLQGVEEYSHLFVTFWLGGIPQVRRGMMKVHPRSRPDPPLVGSSPENAIPAQSHWAAPGRAWRAEQKHPEGQRFGSPEGHACIRYQPISPRNEFPKKSKVPEEIVSWEGSTKMIPCRQWTESELSPSQLGDEI